MITKTKTNIKTKKIEYRVSPPRIECSMITNGGHTSFVAAAGGEPFVLVHHHGTTGSIGATIIH